MTSVGKNVEYELEGDVLTIRVDVSKTFGASSSGKSVTIASTGGNVVVDAKGTTVGLNVYRKV